MDRLKFQNKYEYNQPELKNFFYIYKNYTINEDYKKILEEFYLTEVRSVERYHLLEDSDNEDEKDKKEEKKKEDSIPDLMPKGESNEKLISYAMEDVPTKVDITHLNYKPAKNIKEKIKYVKNSPDTKKYDTDDEEETMVAVEARDHVRGFERGVLREKSDIASSISVNSVGDKREKCKFIIRYNVMCYVCIISIKSYLSLNSDAIVYLFFKAGKLNQVIIKTLINSFSINSISIL